MAEDLSNDVLKQVTELVNQLKSEKANRVPRKILVKKLDDIRQKLERVKPVKVEEVKLEKMEQIEDIQLKSKKIGLDFKNKFSCITALYESLNSWFVKKYQEIKMHVPMNNMILSGGVTGSFIRQLLELPFALAEGFTTDGYGQPNGHDVDIVLFEELGARNAKLIGSVLSAYCHELNNLIKMHDINPEKVTAPKFGSLDVISVSDVTLKKEDMKQDDAIGRKKVADIPHFVLNCVDSDENLYTIDLLAWLPLTDDKWPTGDYNVNSLILNKNGLKLTKGIKGKTSMMQILHCIANKEANCLIDLHTLHVDAFSNNYYDMGYSAKSNLMQIGFFFTNRAKIMAYGYNKMSSKFKVPKFSIENTDECYVTSCKPPYINIHLECSHKISTMAFMGEITKGKNQYKDQFACYLCRKPMRILFEDIKESKIEVLNPIFVHEMPKKQPKINNKEMSVKLFSEESNKYLEELLNGDKEAEQVMPAQNYQNDYGVNDFIQRLDHRRYGGIGGRS